MDLYYIYKITNNLDGKTYIGKRKYRKYYTNDSEIIKRDSSYYGGGKLIKQAIKEFGEENFTKEIIQSQIETKEAASAAEKYYIKCYRDLGKAEYNIADGGDGCTGVKRSEETKRKLSEARKGLSPWSKGQHLSEEHKKKLSEAGLGRQFSEETKRKLSEAHKGLSTWSKGRHWYNNGSISVMAFECPEGFSPGRLKWR